MISVANKLIPDLLSALLLSYDSVTKQYYWGTKAAVSESNHSEQVEEILTTYVNWMFQKTKRNAWN